MYFLKIEGHPGDKYNKGTWINLRQIISLNIVEETATRYRVMIHYANGGTTAAYRKTEEEAQMY